MKGDPAGPVDEATAETRVAQDGFVGVLRVDEAEARPQLDLLRAQRRGARVERLQLVQVCVRKLGEQSQHALAAIVEVGERQAALVGRSRGRKSIETIRSQR